MRSWPYLVVEDERVPARAPAVQVLLAAHVGAAGVEHAALAALHAGLERAVQAELVHARHVVGARGPRPEQRPPQRAARARLATHHHQRQVLRDDRRSATVLYLYHHTSIFDQKWLITKYNIDLNQ